MIRLHAPSTEDVSVMDVPFALRKQDVMVSCGKIGVKGETEGSSDNTVTGLQIGMNRSTRQCTRRISD